LLVERVDLLEKAAEIAPSDRRERDQDRPGLGAGLNQPELGIARPQRIFRLHRCDRVHRARSAERVRRDLAEADRADRPGFDVAGEFADGVLDRDPPVDAMDVKEVDAVEAEPSQRPLQAVADMFRAVVEHAPAVRLPTDGELGRERDPGPAAPVLGQELADHRLADALAVDVGGVPEVDAELERAGEGAHRLALARRSVEAAETVPLRPKLRRFIARPSDCRGWMGARRRRAQVKPLCSSATLMRGAGESCATASLRSSLRSPRRWRARDSGSRGRSYADRPLREALVRL